MSISILHGTLTQVQSTLSPASGYTLPSTVTVVGATSSYSSLTGEITLTSLTSAASITAAGVAAGPLVSSFTDLKVEDHTDYITVSVGDVSVDVELAPAPSGDVIDFSGITLGSMGDKGTLTIYDGQNDSGEVLYEKSFISSSESTNLTTLTFTSGYFYIKWYGDAANGLQNLIATGNVVITGSSSSSARTQYATGTVSGNGSISGQLSIV